ncbi:hypothetical protein HDU76_005115 [Blyttiomyces sp. JEL0837]|nr:hypothetical protein HDU76_005115 [Blyttiomyces sp. JEL0837]
MSSSVPLVPVVGGWSLLFASYQIYLQFKVIKERQAHKITIGDGSDIVLRAEIKGASEEEVKKLKEKYAPIAFAIRAHANFIEAGLPALTSLAIAELNQAPKPLLHVLLATLLLARIAHANLSLLVWKKRGFTIFRPISALATMIVTIAGAGWSFGKFVGAF